MRSLEAKDFLVRQIVDQATLDKVSLSDLERRMLYFTESNDAVEDPVALKAAFEEEHNNPRVREENLPPDGPRLSQDQTRSASKIKGMERSDPSSSERGPLHPCILASAEIEEPFLGLAAKGAHHCRHFKCLFTFWFSVRKRGKPKTRRTRAHRQIHSIAKPCGRACTSVIFPADSRPCLFPKAHFKISRFITATRRGKISIEKIEVGLFAVTESAETSPTHPRIPLGGGRTPAANAPPSQIPGSTTTSPRAYSR
jgi:hypothetical protein